MFGRGGEEALACRKPGIPFVVITGVSSAIAVPAYAGVPVTHRQLSTMFTVVTGHQAPDSEAYRIDYAALVRLGGTLVLLMGVSHLPQIVGEAGGRRDAAGYARCQHRMGDDPAPAHHRRDGRHHRHPRRRASAADHHRDRRGRRAGFGVVQAR